MPPQEWRIGVHSRHLRNLYVYFWRWATRKVFGDIATQEGTARKGIVSYITVSGFLNGPGFQKMRDDLRRKCDEIWVIDCSPDGYQADVPTRIFQGVQQPVCIVMASRSARIDETAPAKVRFRTLPKGNRELKFASLAAIRLDDDAWADCPTGWRAPFLPAASGGWSTYVPLEALFGYSGSGVMIGRVWVVSPDAESLQNRWTRLVNEADPARKEALFHPHMRGERFGDKYSGKFVEERLHGHAHRAMSVAQDNGPAVTPVRYGFRSFDRQWIIPDSRLINQPNPTLWRTYSPNQVYLTALMRHSPTNGPALTFTALVPDVHHYKGSFGGRVFPMWADTAAGQSNVRAEAAAYLSDLFGFAVTGEDVVAYIAAIASHPAYVRRFATNLVQPGLRIPITLDPVVFEDAVAVGGEVIWLHTFGERFTTTERPAGVPRLARGRGPTIPAGGAIPAGEEAMPDTMTYEVAARRLHVGSGHIDNVAPEVWAYEVSGVNVLTQWFSYRKRDRVRPTIGNRRAPSQLGLIQPSGWRPEYTAELLNILHILGRLVELEPRQEALLETVCAGATLDAEALLAVLPTATSPRAGAAQSDRQMSLLP